MTVPSEAHATQEAVPLVPRDLAPAEGEAAVLSGLSLREGDSWKVLSGSLITVAADAATMSWPDWDAQQPMTRGSRPDIKPDLGASFSELPFPGIQIFRLPVAAAEWEKKVEQIEVGLVQFPDQTHLLDAESWSATKLFAQQGSSDAHQVLLAAKRPVRGVAARTRGPELPDSQPHWVRGGSSKPLEEQTREELADKDLFTHWPQRLVGIGWLGDTKFPPPRAFVVGRAQGGTWIADVVPEYEHDQFRIALAWEAEHLDPLGCSVVVRSEHGGAPLLVRHWKISDLPGELVTDDHGQEARDISWRERTLDVRLPRGARRTEWGMSLLGPDGALLDEREVARRVEQIGFEMKLMGESGPGMKSVIGDSKAAPSEAERGREAAAAQQIEGDARESAAHRRLAKTDELETYLRWRFSARAGELLIIDRYLFDGGRETVERVLAFLATLRRDIRALVTKVDPNAPALLAAAPRISAKKAPKGSFHDRLWIVGETGLSVGASLNLILREASEGSASATTAVDLPFADVVAWRTEFDSWWNESELVK